MCWNAPAAEQNIRSLNTVYYGNGGVTWPRQSTLGGIGGSWFTSTARRKWFLLDCKWQKRLNLVQDQNYHDMGLHFASLYMRHKCPITCCDRTIWFPAQYHHACGEVLGSTWKCSSLLSLQKFPFQGGCSNVNGWINWISVVTASGHV